MYVIIDELQMAGQGIELSEFDIRNVDRPDEFETGTDSSHVPIDLDYAQSEYIKSKN
jgi:hypothetical protein